MKGRASDPDRWKTGRRIFLCAAGTSLLTRHAQAESVRLRLVVSKASSLSDISIGDLRQLFLRKRAQLGNDKAIPFNHPPGSPDRVGFDRVVLGMGPDEVARYWVDRRVRSGDAPPRTVDSITLLVGVVAKLQGAVGYVRDGYATPELKTLSIEGRQPGDAGYFLVYA
jgi:hypothetical protein